MGGDTDTNCAIAGALAGAYFGYDSFPSDWIITINKCDTTKGKYPRERYQDAARDIPGLANKLLSCSNGS